MGVILTDTMTDTQGQVWSWVPRLKIELRENLQYLLTVLAIGMRCYVEVHVVVELFNATFACTVTIKGGFT